MTKCKPKWPMSLALKIMLIFLSVLIPVYFLGAGLYISGRDKMQTQVRNSALAQLNLYSEAIESELLSIQQLQYECINDVDTLFLANSFPILNNYERSQYLLRAQNRLIVLMESNNCVESITLHLPSIGKTVTPFRIDPIVTDWDSTYQEIVDNGSSTMSIDGNGKICFSIQYPTKARPGSTPVSYMRITVSNTRIQNILKGFSLDDDSELCYVNGNGSYFVSNKSIGSIPDKYLCLLNSSDETSLLTISGKKYEVFSTYSDSTGMHLFSIVPIDHVMALSEQYAHLFIAFSAISVLVVIGFALFVRKTVHKPIRVLLESFRKLEKGDFKVRISANRSDEFQYLYAHFNSTVEELEKVINQVYIQQLATQRAQLKQLQSQINPHFLYNSFYNIHRMAKLEDYEAISELTKYLGEYYQYITRNAEDEVTMDCEIEHAQAYLNIQSMRFGGNLKMFFGDIPTGFSEYYVPRLIIQPIIENAFEHGMKSVKDPALSITCFDCEHEFGVCVRDNGSGMTAEALDDLNRKLSNTSSQLETSALINTHRRLRMKFGAGSGLKVTCDEDGFSVLMTIEKENLYVQASDC